MRRRNLPPRQARALDQLGRVLMPSVVAVVADRGDTVFTGVFVKYEGRHLIATVAHGMRGVADKRTLDFLGGGRLLARRSEGIVGYVVAKEDVHEDIALIELAEDCARGLDANWVTPDRMSSLDLAPEREVAFIGFPGELRCRRETPEFTLFPPILVHSSISSAPPSPKEQSRLHDETDVLATIGELHSDPEGFEAEPTRDYRGMSGAGVFLLPRDEEAAGWKPERTTLVGLQIGMVTETHQFVFQRAEVLLAALREFDADRPNEWGALET